MKTGICKIFILFLVSSIFLACSSRNLVNSPIDKALLSKTLESGFTGIYVINSRTGEELVSYNAEKHFIPASNIKLYTFYAALKNLSDSLIAFNYQILNDTLFIKGTGDPTFLNSNFKKQKAFEFLNTFPGTIAYSKPDFFIEKFGPGWAWDDYSYSYSAEKSDFPIFGNTVQVIKSNPTIIIPSHFQDSVHFLEEPATFSRELYRNQFYNSVKDNDTLKIPFLTSSHLFVKLLADTLHKSVLISYRNLSEKSWKTFKSEKAENIYKVMLQKSDNFIAEQILLQISQKLTDTLGSQNTLDSLKVKEFKFLPNKMRWVDGSGLSRYNLTTPKNNVFLLSRTTQKISMDKLKELLPAGGKSGTLKNMFISEKPYVFAKTGSMSNNYSLTGIIHTQKGNDLFFSFMNSNFMVPTSEIKQEMEKIINEIYENY